MTLKSAGYMISAFLLVCGVISILVPEKKTGKAVTFVISVATVAVLAFAIAGTDVASSLDFSTDIVTETQNVSDIRKISQQTANELISKKISEILSEKGTPVDYLEINTDISEYGGISIISIYFIPSDKRCSSQIKKTIEEITECRETEEIK